MVKIMQKSRKLVVAGVICAIALLSTCKNNIIGLGGTVDINPPALNVLTIYPPAGAVIRDVFTLSIEATDDSGVASVTANLTQTGVTEQPDSKYTSFDLKKAADGIHWTAKINTKKDDSSFPLQDGSYKVLLTATDTSGKTVRTESTLTIDNTAPLLILNRPSTTTTDSSADVFGDSFLLVGQVYDDTPVAALTITAKRKGKSEPVFTKSIPNVPQNIRLTVDAFSSNEDKKFYQGLYGTSREAGTKYYEYGITVTDDAKIYQAPGDNGSGTGNITDRYYLFDDLYSDVLSEHQIQTVYNMMRGTYRSLTEAGTTRSAAQIEADKNKMAAVQAALKKVQLGGDAERKGTFALNPSINPQFDIAGEKPVAKPKSGEPEFSRLYSDSTLTVKVSCNLDGIPLEGADTYRFFLMEWQKFSNFAGKSTYPEDKINSDEIYANPAEKTLKPEFIELTKSKFEKEGSSYIFSVPVSTETVGLTYGKRYVLLVRGKDKGEKNKPGNNLIPASKKDVPSGVYGFTLAKTGKAPEVLITNINGQAGSGIGGKITKRVFVKKGDPVKFTIRLDKDADITYKLTGDPGLSSTGPTRYPKDDSIITIPATAFNQTKGGDYQLGITAGIDGTVSVEEIYHIAYDVKAPEIVIESPVADEKRNGDNQKLVISGTVFDAGAGLAVTTADPPIVEPLTVKLSKIEGSGTFANRELQAPVDGSEWKTGEIGLSASGYGEGKYELTVTAKDALGQTATQSRTFYYDEKAPEITELKVNGKSLTNGSTVYTKTTSVAVTGKATETYGIKTFTINGVELNDTELQSRYGTNIQFDKSLTLAEGRHRDIKIVLVDKVDKSAQDFKFDVVVDKTAPTLSVTKLGTMSITGNNFEPFSNGYVAESGLLIEGTVTDSAAGASGIDFVRYIFNDGTNDIGTERSLTLDTAGNFSQTIQVPAAAKKLKLICADRVGNEQPIDIVLKVDSKAPNQPVITDVNGKGNTPTIIVSGKEIDGIKIKGTISDDTTGGTGTYSGIKEIRWKLDTASEAATLNTDVTPNAWEFTIPKLSIKGGSVIITATDNVGYTSAPAVVTFLQDTQSPTAKITNFDEQTAQTGDTLVKGSVTDQGTAGVLPEKTKWKVVKRSETAPTVDNPGGDWRNVDKSTVGSWEITTLPLATYFTESGGSYSSEYTTEISAPSNGLFHLPLYLWVEDASENKAVITLTILVDPAGDKPVVTIIAPLSPVDSPIPLSVGGQVAVYGSAKVKTGSVGKVFMDVSTDPNFGSFVSDWHNKKIDGTGSWNTVLNKNNEINNLITGTDRTKIIYYRVWAENGNSSHKTGGYSAVQKLLFDKGAPVIQAAKVHKDGNTVGEDYKGKEWLTDDDDYLTFSISDDTGIKNIRITTTVNGNPTETTLEGKAQIETYQIGGQNVFTAGTAHGAYSDYTAKFPLKTSALTGTGGEYSITITVTEGTATGTTFLTQTATYTFNFDKEAPGGYIGEYIDAGKSVFTGTTLPSILNNAKVGQYLYVNKQQVKIVEDSTPGTKKLFQPVNGTFDWVLYKDRDYFTGSSAVIKGIAYDGGTSGVAKIEGSIKKGSTQVGTSFTVEKDKFRKPIGDFVTWEATVEIPSGTSDGNYTLVYTVEDGNGNKSTALTQTIYIKQKGIHISKVSLGTDLNRSDAVEAGSEEVVPFNESKPQQDERTFDWSGEIDASSFVFKRTTSTQANKVIGTITVEYNGGNAPITYTLKKGNTEIKSGTLASSGSIIPLTQAEFDKIQTGAVELDLEIKDSCGWKSSEKIKTKVDPTDGVKPKGGVLPLFWNDTGAGKNSVVWNGTTAEGHISYDGYNTTPTAPTPTWTDKPAVSGKIIVSGYVYDETLLKEVTVTANGVDVTATFKNDGTDGWTPGNVPASGLSLNVIKQKLNQTGHYAFWELTWDTSKITGTVGSNIQVSVTAKDSSNTQEAENKIKTIEGNDTTGGTNRRGGLSTDLTIAELDNADADMIKEGQTVRLYSSDRDAYYVYIKTKAAVKVNDAKKKLMLGLSDSVDNAITKYQIYTNTAGTTDIKFTTVDVVPYISGLTTSLSELGGNEPDLYARTAQGRYPVKDGETIKVHGFNLAGAVYTVGGIPAGNVSGTESPWELTLATTVKSGKLEATVGTPATAAINNTNNNDKPYNKGVKTANNDKLTDDMELDVWQFKSDAVKSKDGSVAYPMMKIHPDAENNGRIGFAFANGTGWFSMASNSTSYTIFQMNWDLYQNVGFAYGPDGKSYGIASGTDVNTDNNPDTCGLATFFEVNPNGSYSNANANYNGSGGIAFESIGLGDGNINKNRIQSPAIAAGNSVYIAYYDLLKKQLRFRTKNKIVNIPGPLKNPKDSAASNYQIVVSGSSTPFVALGVVSEFNTAGVATSDKAVVLAYYDAATRKLKLKYKTALDVTTAWTDNATVNFSGGQDVQLAVDRSGGIHLAYTTSSGDLAYAYSASYSGTFTEYIVDSYSLTGSRLTIDIANDTNGKPIPYIGYFMQGGGVPKLAYLKDGAVLEAGAKNDYYTGNWEVSVAPTPKAYDTYAAGNKVNVGVWKKKTDGKLTIGKIGSPSSGTENGNVYGNGTSNPVLGYVIEEGTIETAQKK